MPAFSGMEDLSVVFPVHNEASILKETLAEFKEWAEHKALRPVKVILVENGSSDSSAALVEDLIGLQAYSPVLELSGFTGEPAGIGFAYHRGLERALSTGAPSQRSWIMLTASDLPFGFSDLEQFIAQAKTQPDVGVFIGSKAHPQSVVDMGIKRRFANRLFRLMRTAVLKTATGDTQGVFFIRDDIARAVVNAVKARDFFYTTELVYRLERAGFTISEIPVVYRGERRPSSVRILRHGCSILKQMLRTRLESWA